MHRAGHAHGADRHGDRQPVDLDQLEFVERGNQLHADGRFRGAVAGPNMLVADKELAKRACADCSVGAGFDVTLAANGDVLTLDPYRKVVRRFRPKNVS